MGNTADLSNQISVDTIRELRLTPNDLNGDLYRLSIWRVLYILLGLSLYVGLPIGVLVGDGVLPALGITAGMWLVCMGGVLNMREAICEHVVGRWCSQHNISRLSWISNRQELASELPAFTRWAAKHLGTGHSVR
jgi:hypothetical protein